MTDNGGGNDVQPTRHVILIADDDEDILELVRVRLDRSGYETVLARDGAEALAVARERAPALALLDVSMPLMDGYAVTRALRADPATAGIPVILLTARVQKADEVTGFEAGADDYIIKPFSPQTLLLRVASVLKR
jgi:two-component system, OmpR family, phosphate regulon response regulator PhoB